MKFKVGEIIRHKIDRDTCLITSIDRNSGWYYGETVYGGNRGWSCGSPESILSEDSDDWELLEESIVDRVLNKYNNEDN